MACRWDLRLILVRLPGDYLRPEDGEIEGFKARLDERLAPVGRLGEGEEAGDWQVGDCLAQWWRPNFETFMYPFVPAHVTRPKECKKLYFIQLPKSSEFLPKIPMASPRRTNLCWCRGA